MATRKQLIDWVRQRATDEKTPASELADYQLFINLNAKGKDATTAENRQLKKLLVELEQRHESEADDQPGATQWLCTSKELQYLWGVSNSSIKKYAVAGMPRAARGLYDVKAAVDWWLENIYRGSDAEERDESMIEAKRRHWSATADLTEHKLQERRGEFIRAEDHDAIKTAMCSDLRNTMLAWPSRVFPNNDEMRQKLRTEVCNLLAAFVRAGNFDVLKKPARRAAKKVVEKRPKKG